MTKTTQACVCEFLGTFALVFFGCASIIVTGGSIGGQPIMAPGTSGGLVTVALAHGLILSIAICSGMYVSGGLFNPALTLGMVVAGKKTFPEAVMFIVVQLLGAACAAGLLLVVLSPEVANSADVKLGATIGKLTEMRFFWGVIAFEAIGTFALMTSVLAATVDDRAHKLGGFVIGLTLAAAILAIGPLTGGSLNPARTFGPAVSGSHWDMHWAYWLGPVAGACLAAVVYREVWHEGKA
jgi:MIP family channel proteins